MFCEAYLKKSYLCTFIRKSENKLQKMDENNIINPENQEENPEELSGEKIIKVNLENQMKTAYIDYSMSVIISRALPDVRDGLKPVHRRVL